MKFSRFGMDEEKLYKLDSIKEMLGDDDVVKYMIKVFVDSTPETLEELNEGFKENDADKLARSAHKMKASLDLLKIELLYNVVRDIDKLHKVEDLSKNELGVLVDEMNRVLNLVFRQLKEDFHLES